jgi:glycosyltransferase involved in cell wall biosynthesis
VARVAVITADVLAERMAGPAIRALSIAEELGARHDVTLISTAECSLDRPRIACRHVSWSHLPAAVADAEVVIFQGFVSYHAPWLLRGDKVLVVDLYDPVHLEQLEQLRGHTPVERRATHDLTVRVLNEQLVRGDFFLCASEEQRHLWLGQLAAFGRLNPENYDRDPTLRSLLAVCPFGLPDVPAQRSRPAVKGVVPGIGQDDKVVLWAGGVYNWFDPLTLIRAVDRIRVDHADVRLFFIGMTHPNPDVPAMVMATRARQLSGELGLTDKHVFFNDGWVAYDERQNYLLDGDVGVSTHLDHVETTFSFRTRILDYIWAGLPIVATGGDTFGAFIEREGLGVQVAEGDVDALAAGLTRTLYDTGFAELCRTNAARVRPTLTWSRALAPLVHFCERPARAPDAASDARRFVRRPVMPANPLLRATNRAATLLRQGGMGLLAARLAARSRRVMRERRGG